MDETKNVTPETTETATQEHAANGQPDKPEIDVQAALVQSMANEKRYKAAVDKLSSEIADLRKKYNAKLSEDEKASIEKAEKEAEYKQYVEGLERFKAVTEYAEQFRGLGYSDEQARKAAEAQFDGDRDEVLRIQREYQVDFEKRLKAELMKSMPAPTVGNDDEVQMTKEQFKKLSYTEQVKFKNDHPTADEKLAH